METVGSAGHTALLAGRVGVGPERVPNGVQSGGCYFQPRGAYKSLLL